MEKIASKTASQLGAEYWPVSARTGENVDEAFHRMAALAYLRILHLETERKVNVLTIGSIGDYFKIFVGVKYISIIS
jgi:hypothetical protein